MPGTTIRRLALLSTFVWLAACTPTAEPLPTTVATRAIVEATLDPDPDDAISTPDPNQTLTPANSALTATANSAQQATRRTGLRAALTSTAAAFDFSTTQAPDSLQTITARAGEPKAIGRLYVENNEVLVLTDAGDILRLNVPVPFVQRFIDQRVVVDYTLPESGSTVTVVRLGFEAEALRRDRQATAEVIRHADLDARIFEDFLTPTPGRPSADVSAGYRMEEGLEAVYQTGLVFPNQALVEVRGSPTRGWEYGFYLEEFGLIRRIRPVPAGPVELTNDPFSVRTTSPGELIPLRLQELISLDELGIEDPTASYQLDRLETGDAVWIVTTRDFRRVVDAQTADVLEETPLLPTPSAGPFN